MNPSDTGERIAVVETEIIEIKDDIKDIKTTINQTNTMVLEMRAEQNRRRGRDSILAGLALSAAGIFGGLLVKLIDWIAHTAKIG